MLPGLAIVAAGIGLAFAGGRLVTLMGMGKWTAPVAGPWRLSSKYGTRVDPITGRAGARHSGLDFAAPLGAPVVAALGGTVIANATNDDSGLHIIINHGGGLHTSYSHLSAAFPVVGEQVAEGQQIGRVGNSGRSTGAHLHFAKYQNGIGFLDPTAHFVEDHPEIA